MGTLPKIPLDNSKCEFLSEIFDPIFFLTHKGAKALETLKNLARIGGGEPGELEAVEAELVEVDEKLEKHSLTFPILGALVRIFIMEKENMRGKDLIQLSSQTQIYYGDLERRSRKLQKYFSIYFGNNQSQDFNRGDNHVASICR